MLNFNTVNHDLKDTKKNQIMVVKYYISELIALLNVSHMQKPYDQIYFYLSLEWTHNALLYSVHE